MGATFLQVAGVVEVLLLVPVSVFAVVFPCDCATLGDLSYCLQNDVELLGHEEGLEDVVNVNGVLPVGLPH